MDRDTLITDHLALVDRIVSAMSRSWPAWVDRDDAHQAGALGLIDATARFDPERGFQFNTFARHRISGAIIEWMRQEDWASRTTRDQIKAGTLRAWIVQPLDRPTTPGGSTPAEVVADCTPGPGDVVERSEMAAWVRVALSRLNDTDRHVLTAYYFRGRTLADIATELGITESGVYLKRERALNRLRTTLLTTATTTP